MVHGGSRPLVLLLASLLGGCVGTPKGIEPISGFEVNRVMLYKNQLICTEAQRVRLQKYAVDSADDTPTISVLSVTGPT